MTKNLMEQDYLKHFSENTKKDILNHVADLCKQYKFTFKNKEHGQSFGLRLWSGCLSAAKTIAQETMNGTKYP